MTARVDGESRSRRKDRKTRRGRSLGVEGQSMAGVVTVVKSGERPQMLEMSV